jgi:hypothetical protein
MSSNYEWHKQWVQQRLQARYDEAAEHRRARQGSSVTHRQHRYGLKLLTWLATLWHRLRHRQTPPTTSAITTQNKPG